MVCPHCQTAIHEGPRSIPLAELRNRGDQYLDWVAYHQVCPECSEDIVWIEKRLFRKGPSALAIFKQEKVLVWPAKAIRTPPKPQVPARYADDYVEASLVITDSAKASAALSRRCLQSLLRDEVKVKSGNLDQEIQQVIDGRLLPSYLSENLDAVRTIGNFSAHPLKSQKTGEIVDVEPGEAEWSLGILESLFDYLFVQPDLIKKKRDDLNKKLADAGKPPLR